MSHGGQFGAFLDRHTDRRLDQTTNQIINYDSSDGLERVIYRENSACIGKNGRFYFGGINGLTAFNPQQIVDNSFVPPIVVTAISVFDETLPDLTPPHQIDKLILPFDQNFLSFEFAALDFSNPTKNQFSYKLEGCDRNWNFVGTRHFATYTNLSPGSYVLRITGTNNAGVWNREGVRLPIVITPPFWERLWFKSIASGILLLLIIALYTIRLRSLKMRHQLLEKQVDEKTADLTAANTELKVMTDRLQKELGLARKIQQSLLPPTTPPWKELDIVCFNEPALEVGGDFYYYHLITDTDDSGKKASPRHALFVGDVSGKGMPAALLMSISFGSLVSLIDLPLSQSSLLDRMDETLKAYARTTGQFCGICSVEISGSSLTVLNAGGMIPLLVRNSGEMEWIQATGLPLGVILDRELSPPEVHTRTIEQGDMLLMMSDGVVEAMNSDHDLFGFERTEKAVGQGPRTSSEAMLLHLRNILISYTAGTDLHDDLTLIVIRLPKQ